MSKSRIELLLEALIGEEVEILPPNSRVEDILYSILDATEYEKNPLSRVEELLLALKESGLYSGEILSRVEAILKAKLDGEEYTEEPMSIIEALLMEWDGGKKKKGKNLFKTTGTKRTVAGVTYDPQDDGSIICTGTATGYSTWAAGRALVNSGMGNVTITCDGTYGNTGNIAVSTIKIRNASGSDIATVSWSTWTRAQTVNLSNYPDAASIYVELKRNSNAATNAVIKIQVELGTTSTDWEPYIGD